MQIIAVALFIRNNKVLLEKRKEDEDNYAGLWAIPGGHREKEEEIESTLIREIKEELGVKIIKFKTLGVFRDIDPTSKKEYEHHAFLCLRWDGAITQTTEQERIKWFDIDEIEQITKHAKLVETIIEKVRRRR